MVESSHQDDETKCTEYFSETINTQARTLEDCLITPQIHRQVQ